MAPYAYDELDPNDHAILKDWSGTPFNKRPLFSTPMDMQVLQGAPIEYPDGAQLS